jgi:hypothetical protein
VERAFKCRSVSIRNEITESSSKFEILRFAICRDFFDPEIDRQYVRRVEWSGKSVYMPVVSQSGTKQQSFRRSLKDCILRFAGIVSTLKSTCSKLAV